MNTLSITIPGSIRSKKNSKRVFSCGRFKRVLPSKAYEKWEKEAREQLWGKAMIPPLTCSVSVEVRAFYKGPKPDLSGSLESVGDCLQGIIWADDTQIESWDGSRLFHDLKNPRTEIVVRWE